MNDFDKILKEFGNLPDFVRFLNEKINDGEQISSGKAGGLKSKEQKEAEQPAKPPGPEAAPGGAGDPAAMGAPPPIVDPSAAPGSQITLGNKQPDPEFGNYTDEIRISGNKDVINTRPKAKINQTNGTY